MVRAAALVGLFLHFLASSAFPTPDNVARYVREGALDLSSHSFRDILHTVQARNSKRLLFDPLTSPIDGRSIFHAVDGILMSIKVSGDHEWQEPDFESGAQRGPW